MAANRLPSTARPAPRSRQGGLVLIALLLMLMLVGIGALSAAEIWATARKREREVELLWVGEQYRHAVESYWKTTPGPRKILPSSISQLLNDDRFPNAVHHLRQVYRDPMAEDVDFEPIIINNALVGVHSTSKQAPMKHAHFPRRYEQFAAAEDYSQWQFVFLPPNRRTNTPTQTPNPGPLPGLSGARH
jgi:type II secretory pathway pseudopilin PulG